MSAFRALQRATEQESLHSTRRRESRDRENVLGNCAWTGLADFLDRAKTENFGRGATVEQLLGWNENFISALSEDFGSANTRAWLADARKQSERLASLQAFFGQLNKATEALNNTLKETITQVSHRIGYENLPNEILLCIFRHASCTSAYDRKNMSLVCRRFRDLINSEPIFWTSLNNGLHMDIVGLYLTRSKNAGLSIVLSSNMYGRTGAKFKRFVRKVIRHCHRWESFTFSLQLHINRSPLARVVCDLLKGLNLPILQEASFKYPEHHEPLEPGDEQLVHFYTSWNAPRLETISFNDIFPEANDTFRLKTITIDLGYDGGFDFDWSPFSIGEYLSEQPYVENLGLSITDDGTFEPILPLEPFTIPTLRNFCPTKTQYASLGTVSLILKSLDMPVLEALDIHIGDQPLTTEDIDELFSGSKYTNLKSLSLYVSVIDDNRSRFEPVKVILARMQNLQHFELMSPDYETHVSAPNDSLYPRDRRDTEVVERPPLRTINLHDCMGVNEDDVRGLLDWMCEGRHWDDFEQIQGSHSVEEVGKEYLEWRRSRSA